MADAAFNFEYKLVANFFCDSKSIRIVGIAYHLHQTFTIAQINENNTAMIAAAMHPAGDGDFLAGKLLADLAAIVAAHGDTRDFTLEKRVRSIEAPALACLCPRG
jgi:hypothetical protein